MRVLVTGDTGHVGGAIARDLVAAGHDLVGASRGLLDAGTSPARERIRVDLGDPGAADVLAAAAEPCQAVVHAAAAIDSDPSSPAVVRANCAGTQAVLELARRWRVPAAVYISSISVIGVPGEATIDEAHPCAPVLAYQASKLFGEHLCAILVAEGTPVAALRITSPVGPRTPPGRILSVFVERALRGEPLVLAGRGTRRQNYVDVRDVAAAVRACLDRRASGVLNVAGGRAWSNEAVARTVVRVLGSPSEVTFSGRPDAADGVAWDVSIARAADVLGWAPAHDLEASISAMTGSAP